MAGRRYSQENKLNYKKIFAVIVLFIVIIMFIVGIKKLITTGISSTGKISTINYFPVYSQGKWGVINSNGEIVIQPQYDEMPVVPNDSQTVFICTYDVNYEDGTYKSKAVNEKNEEIMVGYDTIRFIDSINKNSQIEYAKNTLIVEKNGKFGLTDLTGKEILEVSYDSIEPLHGVQNSLIITKDGNCGLSDYEGNVIINPEYKEIKAIGTDYKNGYITVNNANLYGIMDFNKTVIFDNKYLDIKPVYSSNKYAVKIDEGYRIVDRNGKILIDNVFEDIAEINDENLIFAQNGKYGITTTSLESKIEPQYEEISLIKANQYIAKKNGKYGVINILNEVQIDFKYSDIKYENASGIIVAEVKKNQYDIYDSDLNLKLSANSIEIMEKYMTVQIGEECKYYNFKFEEKNAKEIFLNNKMFANEKDGKFGFIDLDGKTVVEHKYDEVTEFNQYGYAGIKKDGLWGVINLKKEIVLEPTYNLDKNSVMDFIGKWHKGIGANYYTDM